MDVGYTDGGQKDKANDAKHSLNEGMNVRVTVRLCVCVCELWEYVEGGERLRRKF